MPLYDVQVIVPKHVMSLLSTSPKQQRDRAMEVLKHSLWQMERPEQRLELMAHVRSEISAAEQVGGSWPLS